MLPDPDETVVVGRIAGLFGVRGWVKVFSHTEPRDNILRYQPWLLGGADGWREVAVLDGRQQGKGVVALLEGVDDREAAALLVDTTIAIRRDQLAPLAPGDFYHADLVGLEVVNTDGTVFGRVSHLFNTGANAVLVVQGDRERLLPYVYGTVVLAVDLAAGKMFVDWDPEF